MRPDLEKAIDTIRAQFPTVWAIYLYGSFDTEYERPGSDLDLAVLLDHKEKPLPLWNLAQDIAVAIDRDVDLVDLREVSTVLQNQIITSERRIFCSEPKECDRLETAYLSMYLRFNEERKDWLDDFRRVQHG